MNLIVFTDLDGCLLDHNTYSYRDAIPALNEIKKRMIPLIICTSKTRAEIEVYRKELALEDPFISENGGAIFVPKNYFPEKVAEKEINNYEVIEFGTNYDRLREILNEIKKKVDCQIVGFGDMNPEEVAKDCGLDLKKAGLAKQREYDEAFKIEGSDKNIAKVLNLIEKFGLHYTKGGRYYHIMGENDKGKAVRILTDIYREKYLEIETIALGDSENDFPMLANVDIPVLIKKPDGSHAKFEKDGLIKSKLVGPAGWNEVILNLI